MEQEVNETEMTVLEDEVGTVNWAIKVINDDSASTEDKATAQAIYDEWEKTDRELAEEMDALLDIIDPDARETAIAEWLDKED